MKCHWNRHPAHATGHRAAEICVGSPHRRRRGARSATVAATLAAVAAAAIAPRACAWGAPHAAITRAATEILPEWQKTQWGDELPRLVSDHCFIPDRVHSDPDAAKFAAMDSRPGVRYLVGLHLPASQPENFEVLQYFLGRAVAALAAGRTGDAARYAGTLVHALEDWSCPAHAVPGDNMFTLFKQFLPPPEEYRPVPLHSPIENGVFDVPIADTQPKLAGLSVDEAAFHLLHHVNLATIAARAQVIPCLTALYAHDTNALNAAQQKAAINSARLAADALYTIACLATKRIPEDAGGAFREVSLSTRIPLEAVNLAMPQSSFFSRPYWGCAQAGVSLRGGTNAVPLALRIDGAAGPAAREFADGIGTGTRSTNSFLIPPGVYRSFESWAGLHAVLGTSGHVVFEVLGDGRSLARVGPLKGGDAARRISTPVAGVTNLQMVVTSAGGDGLGNYAVWGAPRLVK